MIELAQVPPWLDGDERWIASAGGAVRADVTLWWKMTPQYAARSTGFLGRYSAGDRDAAATLLHHAAGRLRANRCDLAIGPVDGNTWRSYRFAIETDGTPPFTLEPENPVEWPSDFAAAGFAPLAHYRSHRDRDLGVREPRYAHLDRRFSALGLSLRNLNMNAYEAEMRAIFILCSASFRQNLLYSPIEIGEFLEMYARLRPLVDPRLCILAEHEGRLAGLAFALEDRRDPSGKNVVIKTVARLPERRYAGLGALLTDRIRLAAHEAGYANAVHALMHESNASLAISRRFGGPMRRYALLSRELRT